ncbi:hypothetical protein B0I35DRAFT_414246 [Stachybotrys elegans]|uniref:Uncharacterized protein n=1 Tax=Stachybotrys elegans TaxID=80388 RepID=A0A8K0SFM1_9HYPO|nr:hypothetical protein B0I35DRAFT_414246 [Stachybotrys elegans]
MEGIPEELQVRVLSLLKTEDLAAPQRYEETLALGNANLQGIIVDSHNYRFPEQLVSVSHFGLSAGTGFNFPFMAESLNHFAFFFKHLHTLRLEIDELPQNVVWDQLKELDLREEDASRIVHQAYVTTRLTPSIKCFVSDVVRRLSRFTDQKEVVIERLDKHFTLIRNALAREKSDTNSY